MNASRHLAEVVEFLSFFDVDDGVGGIRRFEANAILVAAIGLNCKVAVNAGDDDITTCWAKRTVNYQKVAIMNSGFDHGIALDSDKAGGSRTLDKKFVQIKRRL